MIISHKYKYIFLKTAKTAGTSIEISLSRFCGSDDIITKTDAKDEEIRKQFGITPQNHRQPLKLTDYNISEWLNLLIKGEKASRTSSRFWGHMPAAAVKKEIGSKIWYEYFKFCFVRNPWDRAISMYYWNLEKNQTTETLDEYLKRKNLNRNFKISTIDEKLAVDYVGKYENLMSDLHCVCDKLNIPFDGWLPKAKSTSRKDRRHYSEVLTKEQAEFIREKCHKEIQLFDYDF